MASIFDEADQKRSVFDEISPKPSRSIFDEPEIIDVRPIGRSNVLRQMGQEKQRLQSVGDEASRLSDISLMSPLNYGGNVVRGAVADLASGLSTFKRPDNMEVGLLPSASKIKKAVETNLPFAASQSGNFPAALADDPLPIDTTLSDISMEAPIAATVGKISQGLAGSAPLIAVMPQGAIGKLVAAGFTADMLRHAGPDASALGEEMGKPPEERDYDKITSSLSSLIQTTAFAPMTGAHAGGRPIEAGIKFGTEKIAPKRAAISELAKALQQEPVGTSYNVAPPGQRQLGVRIPEGEFSQPGIIPLADRALHEAQNPIVRPGQQPAIDALRNEINPPRIDLAEPTRVAERIEGGGEAPYGKVSYRRSADEQITRNTMRTEAPKQTWREDLNAWADDVLNENPLTKTQMGLDPVAEARRIGAVAVKGALFIEKGIANFKDWSVEMVKQFGDSIKPHLDRIWQQSNEVLKGGKDALDKEAAQPVRSVFDEPIKGEVKVPGESLGSKTDVGRGEEVGAQAPEKIAEQRPNLKQFSEDFYDPSKKINNNNTQRAGMELKTIDDLQSVLDLLKGAKSEIAEVKRRKEAGEAVTPQESQRASDMVFRTQLPREVIEMATSAGGWDKASGIPVAPEFKGVARPLDWRDNPEVEAWLRKNEKILWPEKSFDEISGSAPKESFEAFKKKEIARKEALASIGTQKPLNEGGSQESLSPEKKAVSVQNNSMKAFAEASGVPFVEGDTAATILARLQKKPSEAKPVEPEVESVTALDPASGTPISSVSKVLEKADARLAQIQEQIRKGFYKGHTAMGVPAAILDTGLQAARLALKGGKTVAQAIEAAIQHIRNNVKKFDESKVREMFERELSQPEVPVSPKGASKSGSPKIKAPSLEDIYKIFEPEKKSGVSLKKRAVNFIESFRTGISSKFRPINKLAEDIAKAYGRTSSKDIAGIMEQLKGSQGKAEADIYRFDRDVSKLVKGDEKDFNAYVFIRRSIDRLQNDLGDINRAIAGEEVGQLNRRGVANHTLESLNKNLADLQAKLGPEKLAKFEKAAENYQQHLDQALRLQVESGRMAKEVYDAIKEGNQFYAPFKVMKYIEESMRPEGSGKRIDTVADYTKAMKGIEDPNFKLGDLLGAARQSISMSRILADKNNAMRAVAELAAFDTRGEFIQKLKPGQEAPKGMEAVNVLENGKKTQYAVDENVAKAIQLYGGNAGGVMVKALSLMSVPFRAGATALNLPFQVSNLLADVPRQALVSKYGIRGVNDLWRYPADFVQSLFSSISGDVLGKKHFQFSNPQDSAIQQLSSESKNVFPKSENKLFLDFLDSGVAGTTVQEFLTPDALKFKEPTTTSKSKRITAGVLNIIPDFAKAIEQTSKIVGVKRAMRFEGVTSGKELAAKIPEAVTELRRFSGSPDFGRQGSAIEAARLNLLYMFLNARIQGAIADVGRLGGRDGAKTAGKTWRNLTIAIGIPTAYLYWLNNSDEYKEDYDKRPEQEKQNYWLIPKDSFITNDDGEKIRDYWRIPKRESSKWIANFTESAINFAEKRDPKSAKEFGASMIQELTPVNIQGENTQERLESIASGLNPLIKAPLELASGRDLYRHRSVVPDHMKDASPEEQYTQRTAEAFKKLAVVMPDVAPEFLRNPIILENLTRNMTAGLITQFLPRKPMEGRTGVENNPLLARFQGLPYTDNAAFKEEMKGLEREAADEQLKRHRAAIKLLDDNPNMELPEIAAKAGDDVKLINHLADLYVAKQNGITGQERQLLSLPARQRAMYVANALNGLSPDKQEAKITELARKRILTEAVLEELPQFMEP